MSDLTDKDLRRAARDASNLECDGTNYGESRTAPSFIPHYAQRLSWAAVKGTALTVAGQVAKCARARLRRTHAA